MNPIDLLLKVLGVTPIDATTAFITDSVAICGNYAWSFSMGEDSLTTSTGSYTLEVSNDDSVWKSYKVASENVAVVDGLDDTHIPWVYFRIVYNPNGETTGQLSPKLILKR